MGVRDAVCRHPPPTSASYSLFLSRRRPLSPLNSPRLPAPLQQQSLSRGANSSGSNVSKVTNSSYSNNATNASDRGTGTGTGKGVVKFPNGVGVGRGGSGDGRGVSGGMWSARRSTHSISSASTLAPGMSPAHSPEAGGGGSGDVGSRPLQRQQQQQGQQQEGGGHAKTPAEQQRSRVNSNSGNSNRPSLRKDGAIVIKAAADAAAAAAAAAKSNATAARASSPPSPLEPSSKFIPEPLDLSSLPAPAAPRRRGSSSAASSASSRPVVLQGAALESLNRLRRPGSSISDHLRSNGSIASTTGLGAPLMDIGSGSNYGNRYRKGVSSGEGGVGGGGGVGDGSSDGKGARQCSAEEVSRRRRRGWISNVSDTGFHTGSGFATVKEEGGKGSERLSGAAVEGEVGRKRTKSGLFAAAARGMLEVSILLGFFRRTAVRCFQPSRSTPPLPSLSSSPPPTPLHISRSHIFLLLLSPPGASTPRDPALQLTSCAI